MFAVFECVAEAVMNKGVRGLCDFVPGGNYLVDVAGQAYQMLRQRRKAAELREDLAKIAAASTDEARKTAEEVARKVAGAANVEERISLELYLTQMPGAVRASLKRTEDPTGLTVPPDFAMNAPGDVAKILPHRVPHFRPGAELPGRPGWSLAELLGAGGFGEVWLARHTFIPHPRAVKFCTDPLVRTKLTSHEGKVIARVMAQGNHPNVVPLLDAVLDGETPWLMYEYVGGGSLTDLVHRWQGQPTAVRESLVTAALHQLAAAVGTFHRLNPPIVHRDLKPANILVESSERGVRSAEWKKETGGDPGLNSALKITDFGIGGVAVDYLRTHAPAGLSLMSGWLETSLRGSYTPLYASPQQRAGNPPDPRDDVHALGVVGYQMLTGRLTEAPGIDAAEDLQEAGVSDGLIALLTKCVASRPDRRPKDAAELAEKLAEIKTGAKPPAPVKNTPAQATQTQTQTAPPKPQAAPKPSEQVKPAPAADAGKAKAGPTPAQSKPVPAGAVLEGGSMGVTVTAVPVALSPTKWLLPVRGLWFTRPADNPDAGWTLHPAKLPGDVTVKPGEAYRLALNPDTATDTELAKLKALAGLPGLEAIDLSGCTQVTDAGLMHLANLRHLKGVGLSDTRVTDSGVTLLLTRFPELEAVGLSGAENVSSVVLPYLMRMRKLKALSLPPRADSVDVRVEFGKRRPTCRLA